MDILEVEKNFNKKFENLVNLLDGKNPFEILAYHKIREVGRQIQAFEEDELHYKKNELIQRIYCLDKVNWGEENITDQLIDEIDDLCESILNNKSTIDIMEKETEEGSGTIVANRYLISHKIHPQLFYAFSKHVTPYFFSGESLKNVDFFLKDIAYRETKFEPQKFAKMYEVGSELDYFKVEYSADICEVIKCKKNKSIVDLNIRNMEVLLPKNERDFYIYNPTLVIDNYFEILRLIYLNQPSNDNNKFNKDQMKMTEELTSKFLQQLLPNSKVYENVKYQARTGKEHKKNTCELDILLEYDKVLFICEVKGSRVFSGNIKENGGAFSDNKKKLLTEPRNQALRFYNELKKGTITIGEEEVNYDNYDNVIILNVTMEHLDTLALEVSQIAEDDKLFIWNICLSDLFQYTKLFKHPADFLKFLMERIRFVKIYNEKKFSVKIYDEFIFYGMYVTNTNFSKIIEELPSELNNQKLYNIHFGVEGFLSCSNEYIRDLYIEENQFLPPQYANYNSLLVDILNLTSIEDTRVFTQILLPLLEDNKNSFRVKEFLESRSNDIKNAKTHKAVAYLPALYLECSDTTCFVVCVGGKYGQRIPQALNKEFSIRFGRNKNIILLEISNENSISNVIFHKTTFGNKTFEKTEYKRKRKEYKVKTNNLIEDGIKNLSTE